jgi:multiple sugar transport system permease protein
VSATVAETARTRQWFRSSAGRQALWAYLFLAPNVVLFLIFTLFPVFAGLAISFTKWDLLQPWQFIGLGNYVRLTQDPDFRQILGNTFYYTFGVIPPQTALALLIAAALNQKVRGLTLYRTLFFVPVVTSEIAVAMVWQWLYQPDFGVINSMLALVGIQGPTWLFNVTTVMPAVIAVSVWKNVGYSIVIFLAAMQGVPEDLHEAAKIDGAGAVARFFNITVPMITPSIFFVIVLSIIGSFQVFGIIYVLTQGGPAKATTVLVYYLYQNGFQWFAMGYAAALAYVLFALVFIMTLVQWAIRRRWVYGEQ